ncbi:MAG: hypothetical protein WCS31_01390 [Verrucomicrobiae bacterium]
MATKWREKTRKNQVHPKILCIEKDRQRIEPPAAGYSHEKVYHSCTLIWPGQLDFRSRGMRLIERAPKDVLEDVLSLIDASVF